MGISKPLFFLIMISHPCSQPLSSFWPPSTPAQSPLTLYIYTFPLLYFPLPTTHPTHLPTPESCQKEVKKTLPSHVPSVLVFALSNLWVIKNSRQSTSNSHAKCQGKFCFFSPTKVLLFSQPKFCFFRTLLPAQPPITGHGVAMPGKCRK